MLILRTLRPLWVQVGVLLFDPMEKDEVYGASSSSLSLSLIPSLCCTASYHTLLGYLFLFSNIIIISDIEKLQLATDLNGGFRQITSYID